MAFFFIIIVTTNNRSFIWLIRKFVVPLHC
nr:MAG TPA: hypothetical protein [Caudoviricetes sp.]